LKENLTSTKTISVIKGAFREYYFKNSIGEIPFNMDQREFGYMQFGQAGMLRHLSFKTLKELKALLVKEAPSDVFCSNAYYEFPTKQPMQEKHWVGADLIFDIDGKDLQLPCIPTHSYAVCLVCGHALPPTFELPKPVCCSSCNSNKFNYISLPCTKCIDASKKEITRLIDLLIKDIGLEDKSVNMYFSGNNGFHVQITHDSYKGLDPYARSDLVGYLSGKGFMAESIGVRKGTNGEPFNIRFPRGLLVYGWRRRIADKLKIDSTSKNKLKYIVEQKGGYIGFKSELDSLAKSMGVKLDPQVTTDVHRVFRLPGTLNSKSGLAKAKCSDISSFDPFISACLIGDEMTGVRLKTPVNLNLMGKSFNISRESVEIPKYAAVYLMCKGLAEAN
jgi:DNA primase small subunit